MLLPVRCPLCRHADGSPCMACASGFRRAGRVPAPDGVDFCHAVLRYEGAAADLIAGLKFRNGRRSARWLGAQMAMCIADTPIDVITFVPASPKQRRRRGFDQAELLAREIGHLVNVPARRLLCRTDRDAQRQRTRVERLEGPRLRATTRAPARVVLVDDITTTGGSLAAAAKELRSAGAVAVTAVTAAWTPG